MAKRFSTGAWNAFLASVKTIYEFGAIQIYSGVQPLTADGAISGTLLGLVTVAGGSWTAGSHTNGLEFDAPSAGVLQKKTGQQWAFTGLADGTAGWFRFVPNTPSDGGGTSTTLIRLDGTIGQGTGEMSLGNVLIETGSFNSIDAFAIRRPVGA
jgi:hypothetical protein